MWVVQLSWGCQTGEASGGASWEPGYQAISVVGHVTVPSSMSSLANIWLSLWEASNQNCPPEPFPSSQPTKLQAKLNDYFKPLSLGVICDAAIVKGIICEWKPEITKSQTLFFPLHNYLSFISHSLYMWITAMMGPPSEGWKWNVGLWLLPLPKAGMIQSPNFQEWTFQVGRKKANSSVIWFENF